MPGWVALKQQRRFTSLSHNFTFRGTSLLWTLTIMRMRGGTQCDIYWPTQSVMTTYLYYFNLTISLTLRIRIQPQDRQISRRWANVVIMLGRRRRRRANIIATLNHACICIVQYAPGPVFPLPCRPLRGRGWMYLLYPKNTTWRWLRAIPTPRSEKCP